MSVKYQSHCCHKTNKLGVFVSKPNLTDVIAAKNRIENFITRTPLHRHLALEKIVGTEVHVKHENHQK